MLDWNDLIRRRLAEFNLPPVRESEIVEELSQHAEDRYQELLSGGATETEAQRMVLKEMTAHELQELRSIERTSVPESAVVGLPESNHFMTGFGQDLRYGLRTLRNSPGFTLVAMLALSLGIGANTAIFSVVNGILLQPLSFPDPDRLVKIFETTAELGQSSVAYPNYLDWRRDSHSFTDMGIVRSDDFNFTGSGEPEQLAGEFVSASLFPLLGVSPVLGRNFVPEEDREGAACSVMLSYGFWQRRFGGDRNTLGKTMTLNAMNCSVVGILPREFRFRDNAALYVPIEIYNSAELRTRESHPGLGVIARLKAGVAVDAAQAEMSAIAKRLAVQYPKSNQSHSTKVIRMKDDIVQYVRPTLLLLVGAVGFVLIIACANVANLSLARSTARKREFAIRAALGADRWRVVRQLLAESLLLSLGGAAIGVLLARWGTSVVLAAAPGSLPRSEEIGIDMSVLAFTLSVSIVTGILFGLAPAFQGANADPQESLKSGTRGAGGGRRRMEGVFVAMELGFAVILLAGAGLMMQSVWRLLQVDPGFNPRNILTMQVALSPKVMDNAQEVRQAYPQMLQRVVTIPGAQSAAITSLVPLGDNDAENGFWAGTGPQPSQDQMKSAMFYLATSDYFKVMQIPLRRGRFFTDRDRVGAPTVVVIDDVLANHLFPNQDAVGRQFSLMVIGVVQIVGVVGHVKQWGLDTDDRNKIRDQIYFPLLQVPDKYMRAGITGLTLAVRTEAEPLSLMQAVRAQVAGPSMDQPVYSVRTMEQIIGRSLAGRRFAMLVLIIFAGSALLLAAMGIYGVMSYTVNRRMHELGVRSALGASRMEIVRLVLRQGMRPALVGMTAGLIAAVTLTRFMATLLYGVRPADPVTLAAATLLLGGIALLACYIPARRATKVDPVTALRCD